MKCIVFGAGGFIGSHLVTNLHNDGHYVIGIDIKYPEFSNSVADKFILGDLRDISFVRHIIENDIDELYQLAADMGGAEYLFSGKNDADVMTNSIIININTCKICVEKKVKKVFFSSSACVYPEYNQLDPTLPICSENTIYPAQPDSEYGWEKLFSERLYLAYHKNYNLDVRIARFHNIYGPYGTWTGGKEKAPAAITRKIILNDKYIEIFGNGTQTRSFLYIDECIKGIRLLMKSNCMKPLNIGSEYLISINDLAHKIMKIGKKQLDIIHIDGPIGVNGRCSDNKLIMTELGWKPDENLDYGLTKLYEWISKQTLSYKQYDDFGH